MRALKLTIPMAVLLTAVLSCHKSGGIVAPASFTVIHAMPTGNPIVPVFGGTAPTFYNISQQVNYGGSQIYSPLSGVNPLWVVPITDTVFSIFNGKVDLVAGGIYSFFLSGDTAHADTMLVKDNIPVFTDSAAGIRFVNLAAGGKALTINLAGDSGHLQFPVLGYHQISDFSKYVANSSVPGNNYKFEIRDQASGTVLNTYTWNYSRWRNNTIVIAGSTDTGGSIPLKIFAVNNY